MRSKVWKVAIITIAAFMAAVLAIVVVVKIVDPGPAGRIVIATGGSQDAFQELAQVYKADLAKYGVTLELRPNVAGNDTIRGLLAQYASEFKTFDPKTADITAAFVKGGVAASLQGRYADERQQLWHQRQVNDLRSLGRLFYEPLWVFVRAGEPVKGLRDLKGHKINIGAAASGSRSVANRLLMSNGVTPENSTIVETEFPADAAPLLDRDVDAAMMFLPAESTKIQALLRNRKLMLLDFAAEAEAYTFRFPALSKVVLRQGAIEFNPDTPTADVTLLATSVALVVRASLNSSLQTLLAHAVIANPKAGYDAKGEPILFYKAGEFPTSNDPEYTVPPTVRQMYKTGDLPTLLRGSALAMVRLHLPFWPAAFLNEHGTQTALLIIPALSILLPLFHYIPLLYKWGVRQRVLNRYQQLKTLEASIGDQPSRADIAGLISALDSIDAAASRISVPLPFSDQVYDLRGHIDLVRRRLELIQAATKEAAAKEATAKVAAE